MRLLAVCVLVMLPCVVQAAAVRIVASVDNQVITSKDIEHRVEMVLATTGMPDTEESKARLAPQVLQQMVDETLQRQEAKTLGIAVSDAEVDAAMASVEKQRGLAAGSLLATTRSKAIPDKHIKEHIRSQVMWSKLVARAVRPQVKIGDDELQRAQQLPQASDKEIFLATLDLPVDAPEQTQQVTSLAQHLAQALQSGADFQTTARELAPNSQARAPAWVPVVELEPSVRAVVEALPKGGVSAPIKTESGFVIFQVLDTRLSGDGATGLITAKVFMAEAPTPQGVEAALQAIKATPGACEDSAVPAVLPEGARVQASLIEEQPLDKLSDALKRALAGLGVGDYSPPFIIDGVSHVVWLCERTESTPQLASREAVYNRLFGEKMELEARKYMRNLRRNAFIDIKAPPSSEAP